MTLNSFIAKLFFPKIVVIDEPGYIISKTVGNFSDQDHKKRYVYHFEDPFVNLQLETIKSIGKEKTSELHYKIGKEIGHRYFLFSNVRKVPNILVPAVVEHIFSSFNYGGVSVADKINFDSKTGTLVLEGKDNLYCRKSGESEIITGVVSGIMSSIFAENIEAEKTHCCCNGDEICRIIAGKHLPEKHLVDINELRPMKNYLEVNFYAHNNSGKSFSDHMKFNQAGMDESGKFHFYNKTIVPCEIGMYGLVAKHYKENGLEQIFKRSIISSSEKIFTDLFGSLDKQKQINAMCSLMCALGLGFPKCEIRNDAVKAYIECPPISKYSFEYQAYELNGYLNAIMGRKLNLDKIKQEGNPPIMQLEYS